MSIDKNGRKNLALAFISIGILIITCLVEFNVFPKNEDKNTSTVPETSQVQSKVQTAETEEQKNT